MRTLIKLCVFGGLGFCLLIAAMCGGLFASRTPSRPSQAVAATAPPVPAKKDPRESARDVAYLAATKIVVPALKDPASAVIDPADIGVSEEDAVEGVPTRWVATGTVRAKNSFGATVAEPFRVRMFKQDLASEDTTVFEVTLGDRQVYRADGFFTLYGDRID